MDQVAADRQSQASKATFAGKILVEKTPRWTINQSSQEMPVYLNILWSFVSPYLIRSRMRSPRVGW